MNIVWWGSEAGRVRATADGVVAESRGIFAEADIIGVHVRLNRRHMD